ncbi:hypothetical protein PanWU01x14_256690 [Parasponia andersonii]|uniref:Sodium/calcium exchanger membrane region domain-containing protein n=1 Tax=Parasponia andersonii TaxID=3476 RepID=A0A2P5BA63_PARAD|nr:hypothetical protein PanWU01x14_256690 [Parasponia andersonii]
MFKATHFTSFFFFFFFFFFYFFLVLLMILCGEAYCRLITTDQSSADLVSDGSTHPLALLGLAAESSACEESYVFLPCTTSVLGNLFLIMVHGYLMFLAPTYLSSGSELLLEILGPGLVGGLFLPMLGSLPMMPSSFLVINY